ncbi:excalibur calcium-binding domain-containing protein [Luteimonas sp. 50]|uniref:Excalibur calcium-binding domain-containing protein n=1 Tax=Cognatiluteimonas sedimenti TaxID=2927791 RepID=A0ABT0A0F5_9GAMM|nr:excalibur calcium-binding domain-containing protein [Lysobacter sedimenti]MCJ0824449.1 excalibur calcium-binding domain-containing protein [Lysobacter sedimenti]
MKNIIVIIVLASLAWFGYGKFKNSTHSVTGDAIATPGQYASAAQAGEPEADSPFRCDGRTMCPQMTSCAEATYFIKHCPNTKMDGNNDGVPCERQWCN